MSTQPTLSSEEERREAAELAREPSDEELDAAIREEAHHHRRTAYVPRNEPPEPQTTSSAQPSRGEKSGEAGEPSASSREATKEHGGDTAAEMAKRDREQYGVQDSTKMDAVRLPSRRVALSRSYQRSQATTGPRTASETPARVRDSSLRS
jgi:hypothetical protein